MSATILPFERKVLKESTPVVKVAPDVCTDELGAEALAALRDPHGSGRFRSLLQEHPELANWRPAGRNLLMLATLMNQHRQLQMVLRTTQLDIEEVDGLGLSALMMAAEQRAPAGRSLPVLLALGADVHRRDPRGNTALMMAAQSSPEQLPDLLDVGSAINAQNDQGRTALMLAIQTGHSESVDILRGPSDWSVRCNQGWTAARWAFEALMSNRNTLAEVGMWGDGLEPRCVDAFAGQWSLDQCARVLERHGPQHVPLCAARIERNAIEQTLSQLMPRDGTEGPVKTPFSEPPRTSGAGARGFGEREGVEKVEESTLVAKEPQDSVNPSPKKGRNRL